MGGVTENFEPLNLGPINHPFASTMGDGSSAVLLVDPFVLRDFDFPTEIQGATNVGWTRSSNGLASTSSLLRWFDAFLMEWGLTSEGCHLLFAKPFFESSAARWIPMRPIYSGSNCSTVPYTLLRPWLAQDILYGKDSTISGSDVAVR